MPQLYLLVTFPDSVRCSCPAYLEICNGFEWKNRTG